MKDDLAENLLLEVMRWREEENPSDEMSLIQTMAGLKYDEYQQYSAGMRFVGSLANWLNQFEDGEKRVALNFIKKNLLYIAQPEMYHLVSISYPDYIRPIIVDNAIRRFKYENISISKIVSEQKYKILLRQCLFLGLSDGAHIDIFRRNSQISNEQVYLTYEIAPGRADDLKKKLIKDLKRIVTEREVDQFVKFSMIFLLDDFTASGTSYISKKTDGTYSGKVSKVLESIYNTDGALYNLVDKDNLIICLVIYIATENALEHIKNTINLWFKEKGIKQSYILA